MTLNYRYGTSCRAYSWEPWGCWFDYPCWPWPSIIIFPFALNGSLWLIKPWKIWDQHGCSFLTNLSRLNYSLFCCGPYLSYVSKKQNRYSKFSLLWMRTNNFQRHRFSQNSTKEARFRASIWVFIYFLSCTSLLLFHHFFLCTTM